MLIVKPKIAISLQERGLANFPLHLYMYTHGIIVFQIVRANRPSLLLLQQCFFDT